MMNIRKVSAILLAMLLLITLVACGQSAPAEEPKPAEPEESGQPFLSEVHASMLLLSAVSILVLVSVTRRKKEK